MKTTIFYFSGTGNSLKIARDLCEELEECEIISIAKIFQQEQIVARSEKVGFICPLYYWGLPDIVVEFVKKFEFKKTNYVFIIVTRGYPGARMALSHFNKLIKKKSKTLDSGFYITMPGNYICKYNVISDERQKKLFKNAKKKTIRISQIIKNNKKKIDKEKYIPATVLRNKVFRNKVNNCDNKFNVNENCDSCGICEKICPVNNIVIVNGNPQWQHRCQQCQACIQFCPQEAIQCDTETINRRRYRHPDITANDMVAEK